MSGISGMSEYQIEQVCGVHINFSAQTVLRVAVVVFTIIDVWGG